MPVCKDCGEFLEGDGYKQVLHCPNSENIDCIEPDANPVYCGLGSDSSCAHQTLGEDL